MGDCFSKANDAKKAVDDSSGAVAVASGESPNESGAVKTVDKKEAGAAAAAAAAVDWEAVRKDIKSIMESDTHDDGSYAPILIRLGWHSSGTYDPNADKKGGSNNAGMRFAPESNDPENAGLKKARDLLVQIKEKHPQISYSDLWIIASYVAIEVTGGPVIEFTGGRKDGTKKTSVENGRLPEAEFGLTDKTGPDALDEEGRVIGWENLAQHIRDVFGRMGFEDKEIVALLCGGHVYGRCHKESSGYAGAWVESPLEFSNEYAADMIEDEWMFVEHDTKVNGVLVPEETRPIKGKRQYMGKWEPSEEEIANGKADPPKMEGTRFLEVGHQMMLVSDMVLLWDQDFRKHLEVYADEDSGLEELKKDFGVAFKRLTENGFTGCPFAK